MTSAHRLIDSLNVFTVAFNIVDPLTKEEATKINKAKHTKRYRFRDGSMICVQTNKGKSFQWFVYAKKESGPYDVVKGI